MHQPKGSMCMVCAKKLEDCSKLPFDKMRPMEKASDAVIVICSEFKKNENNIQNVKAHHRATGAPDE
jgi:hypothetical protein